MTSGPRVSAAASGERAHGLRWVRSGAGLGCYGAGEPCRKDEGAQKNFK
jgi:hypothetical protein